MASHVNVYALAFVREADMFSTCGDKDDVMCSRDFLTDSRLCRFSVNYFWVKSQTV